MSVELLKLTSASLPSSDKPILKTCKPVVPTSPPEIFDDSIFSPLPTSKPAEETSIHSQVDNIAQEPTIQQRTANPSFSPITVVATDNYSLFGTPTPSSVSSNNESVSTEGQSSVQSIPSSNTSTPNSIQVKISSNKLKEIPSPHSQINEDKCSSSPAHLQTPPRALGVKKNYQSQNGLHLKPNNGAKPVKKALSQGIMTTGQPLSVVSPDESSVDDSIVVVSTNDTEHMAVKDKLCQKKEADIRRQPIVVYPNVFRYKEEEEKALSAKEIQTENVSVKFDETTQCEEVVMCTQGIQTSPNNSEDIRNAIKQRSPHNQQHPFQSLPPTSTVVTSQTTSSQQLSTDAMTLIASTAAAAAVAASASLHNNNRHTEDACLTPRNGSCASLPKHLREMSTNTTTGPASHTATQTVEGDELTARSSSCTNCNNNLKVNNKAKIIFDHASGKKNSHQPGRLELIKQKYGKFMVDDAAKVLQNTAVAEEEIEHQCATLECSSSLADFTEAMIEGKSVQERIRIRQHINKLIEQNEGEDDKLTSVAKPTTFSVRSLETRKDRTRPLVKSNQRVTKIRKRPKVDHIAENCRRHFNGGKLNYAADARDTSKTHYDISMNPLWRDTNKKMNFADPRVTAIPLGPPRQAKSHYGLPVTSQSPVVASVGCQVPSYASTPVKDIKEFSKGKPPISTCSIELLPPVNISSSSGMTEATVMSSGKPSSAGATNDDPRGSNRFQQVLDISSHSTANNSHDVSTKDKRWGEGASITVEGEVLQSATDYQGPTFPPKPVERLNASNVEALTISASDLEKKLKENLEQKAMEWIQQELIARLAADRSQDPVGHTNINSCSTCSIITTEEPPGMCKMSRNGEDEYVKVLVYEELLGLIKKVLKEKLYSKEKANLMASETSGSCDASSSDSTLCHLSTPAVTPPSSPTNLQPTKSSPHHVTSVTTPLPTPTQSPTPSVQKLVEISMESESNSRILTPKSSLSSSSNDDIDSSLHNIMQVVNHVTSNLSSPNTTPPAITTSVAHTPQPSETSRKKPSVAEETAVQHTIEPTTSSDSSSTSGSPAVSDAASSSTTTTTTTDHEISMGEYILTKPSVVQRVRKVDCSLSDGEAPLSPGDARWNTLHKGKLNEKKKKDDTRLHHPVVEAFLELKQAAISPERDTDSATEFSADSLQFKPQSLSNGEVWPCEGSHDPFKKLLDKLNSSSSSNDSTTTVQEEDIDNTLSEVTSLATQDISSMASPPQPSPAAVTATSRSKTSPGELVRNLSVLPAGDDHSQGEIPHTTPRSPGEIPPILRASETRDGIDVIRISKWSNKLTGNSNKVMPSESQYLMEQFDSSEIIRISSSCSSTITQEIGNDASQTVLTTNHTSGANDSSAESQVKPSDHGKPCVVEEEASRKMVTINIPDVTATGFYSDSTEMTFSVSEITSSLSSKNF